jgi:hypothetical protein
MKFKQNSSFHFNKVSLKLKIKKKNKEPLFDFIEEEISRANRKRKYIFTKLETCIYSEDEIFIQRKYKILEF